MKYFSISAVLFLVTFLSNAQQCNAIFLGEIKDFHDGTPIVGATIQIKSLDRYVTSDINGTFKIENLCKGTLTLEISHINCETKTVSYTVTGDMFKTITLEHHIEELEEVSIKSNVAKKTTVTAQESVLKAETIKRYSSLSLGDALKEVPGVSSLNTGNTIVKPMINGLHSSRLIIMNNNVRLQDQEWGIEHAPNIDINAANQISVIKGSGALAFGGDAVGGVIVLKPSRVIAKDTLYGKTTISGQTNGRGYSVASSLNKSYASGWFANLQGAIKQYGDFEAPDYVLTNTGLQSSAFSFGAGKRKFESGFDVFYSCITSEIGILRSSHIGNISDLVEAINSQQPLVIEDFSYDINPPKQEVTHHMAKASYYKRFENFGKVSVQYDYQNNQRFEFDIRRGDRSNIPAVDLRLQTHSLLADVNLDANLERKINFGLLGRYQNNFANPDTGVRRLIPDYDKYDFGAYITSEWVLNDKTTIDAGLRYDFNRIDAKKFYITSRWEERGYDEDFADIVIEDLGTQLLTNPVFDFHNISASVGGRFNITENSYILGNYSLSSRPPNPSELFSDGLHHSAARIELGDLRLEQEISNRFGISYGYTSSSLNVLVEGFYNNISDFIYIEPFGIQQTIRGAFPVWNYIQSDSELYGFDINADYNISPSLNLSNKSSYTVGTDNGNGRALIDIPAFNTFNTITFSNPKWKGFIASLTSEWIFEQTRFPDNDFTVRLPSTDEEVLVEISQPPSAFHLLHFYSEVTLDAFKNTKLNIALSVNNLLNTKNRDYLNRLRFFADDLGRNIMLQLQLNY